MIWKSKKLLAFFFSLGLLLSVGLSTLLTNNAQAYDITTNVSPTGKSWEWGNAGWLEAMQISGVGEYNKTSTGAAIFWGRGFSQSGLSVHWILKSVASGNDIEFVEGNYYKTQLSWNVVGYLSGTPTQPIGIQLPILNRMVFPSNSPYKLVSVTPTEVQCYEAASYGYGGNTSTLLSSTTGCYRGNVVYDIIVQATRTATGKLQLGDGAQWMFQSYVGINYPNGYGTLTPLTITEYKPESVSTVNQEQQQAGEQAQQDGNNSSSNSQQQAQQGGQTLLKGFSDFVGALTSASASNCVINGDIGDFKMGNMDLCQLSPPPAFQAISSIMVIGFVVPLSIATIRKFIGMFRSFQNG